jgi:NTP pyrophosphatase (non-canonical NTP hydrolase)
MMLMKMTPDQKDLQPTPKTQTTPTWQACIVEELDEVAQAAVVGGAKGGVSGKPNSYDAPLDTGTLGIM